MNFLYLLLLQLLAHFLADYTFQNDKKAMCKNQKGFKSTYLKWHILIVFITSWILSFQLKFVVASLLIAITHWLIDGLKPKLNKGKYSFFIDQILHISIIIVIIYFYIQKIGFEEPLLKIPIKYILLFLAFYLTEKPANILIREIFKLYKIKFNSAINELLNAGKLIGIIERWLILFFVFLNQYEAIGFLIAAKSILRYNPNNDKENFNKTEYVLVGTMLSFFIAIFIGTIIKMSIENIK
jgi:hypothetical protein